MPESVAVGAAVKLIVDVSKASQAGSGLVSAKVAEKARVSPTSASVKLGLGSAKRRVLPPTVVRSATVAATMGASLTSSTCNRNSPLAAAPAVSLAVTRMSSAPTSALAGVPLKVRLAASKRSQPGRGAPLASVVL